MTTGIHLGMSVAEFMQQFDTEGPFELIDGEIIPVPPNVFGHTVIANKLLLLLTSYAQENNLGEAFVEATFTLVPPDDPNWVTGSRIPDVMFIKAEKLAAYKAAHPDWRNHPLGVVPDLVVEIMSPNDTFSESQKKARRYLQDGVSLVWLIDPNRLAVYVYTPDTETTTPLTEDDKLTGADILAGFELDIAKLFE